MGVARIAGSREDVMNRLSISLLVTAVLGSVGLTGCVADDDGYGYSSYSRPRVTRVYDDGYDYAPQRWRTVSSDRGYYGSRVSHPQPRWSPPPQQRWSPPPPPPSRSGWETRRPPADDEPNSDVPRLRDLNNHRQNGFYGGR